MKKNTYLIFILQFLVCVGYSQTITYDFLEKNWKLGNDPITEFRDIKYHSIVTIEIININRFLFDATLEANEKNYNTDVPALFRGQILNLFDISKATDSAIQKNIPEEKETTIKKGLTSGERLSEFKDNYDKLINIKDFFNALQQVVNNDQYGNRMMKAKKEFAAGILHLDSSRICGADIEIYGRTQLKQATDNYNYLIKDTQLKKNVELLKEINQIYEDIKSSDYVTIIDKVALLYDMINAKATIIRFASIPPVSCDEIEVKIRIIPKSNVQGNSSFRSEMVSNSIYTKGGFKIDFSSGIYASNLINQQFTTREERNPQDSITGYTLLGQKTGPVSLGIMALMHVTYRVTCQWNVGLNFGVGLDVYNNQSLKFLSGASIIIGKHQRFILNGGVAIGPVDRLSSDLEIEKTYPTSPKITTVKVIDFGFFAGITFNITGN